MCSVLPKVFWAPVLRTSGSWSLPVRMEGSLVRNFNNYYVLLIHVFDGCSNRFDPYDHFNLVCCCPSPVLISDKRSCWKISQSLKPKWLDVEMLVPLFKKINQRCRDACQISEQLEDSKRLSEKLRQKTGLLMWYWISPKTCSVFSKLKSDSPRKVNSSVEEVGLNHWLQTLYFTKIWLVWLHAFELTVRNRRTKLVRSEKRSNFHSKPGSYAYCWKIKLVWLE